MMVNISKIEADNKMMLVIELPGGYYRYAPSALVSIDIDEAEGRFMVYIADKRLGSFRFSDLMVGGVAVNASNAMELLQSYIGYTGGSAPTPPIPPTGFNPLDFADCTAYWSAFNVQETNSEVPNLFDSSYPLVKSQQVDFIKNSDGSIRLGGNDEQAQSIITNEARILFSVARRGCIVICYESFEGYNATVFNYSGYYELLDHQQNFYAKFANTSRLTIRNSTNTFMAGISSSLERTYYYGLDGTQLYQNIANYNQSVNSNVSFGVVGTGIFKFWGAAFFNLPKTFEEIEGLYQGIKTGNGA